MRAKGLLSARAMLTAFVNELVATRHTPQEILPDDAALAVMKRLVKQRKEHSNNLKKAAAPNLQQRKLLNSRSLKSSSLR